MADHAQLESVANAPPDGVAAVRHRAIALGSLAAILFFSAIFLYHRAAETENSRTAAFLCFYYTQLANAILSEPTPHVDSIQRLQVSDRAIQRIVLVDVGGTDELGIARGQAITFDTAGKAGQIDESDRQLATRANKVIENTDKVTQHAIDSNGVERTNLGYLQAAAPIVLPGVPPTNVVLVELDPARYHRNPNAVPGWLAIVLGPILGFLYLQLARWRKILNGRWGHTTLGAVALCTISVFGITQTQLVDDYRETIQETISQGNGLVRGANVDGATANAIATTEDIEVHVSDGLSGVYVGALIVVSMLVILLLGPMTHLASGLMSQPTAYAYIVPALMATLLLVFVPFAAGVGLAFFDAGRGEVDSYRFVGLGNFLEILFPSSHAGNSFYFTLGVTLLWTISNVVMHVAIGLTLALMLNRPNLRFRGVYRVLLIIPWAVPSYITALIWKGMFNYQYGAINQALILVGMSPINWFGQSFWTNFFANLATNVWLGFPFMMVVSLGALQSIPKELYEAASMDGASKFQQLRSITLPLLKPALFPAILLGTIWTFNMFNVIYLVSGGGPDNQTNILITEAFYQFKVLGRYGFAAAYAIMIFLILLAYALVTNRVTKATEGAY